MNEITPADKLIERMHRLREEAIMRSGLRNPKAFNCYLGHHEWSLFHEYVYKRRHLFMGCYDLNPNTHPQFDGMTLYHVVAESHLNVCTPDEP